MNKRAVVNILVAIPAALITGAMASDLPQRAAGLWELKKAVADEPRALPAILQCSDAATDAALGANAFLAKTDSCERIEVARDGDKWRIESLCNSEAGPVEEVTLLSGDFDSGYTMEQVATFSDYDMEVRQTVTARRIGDCGAGQEPGNVYIGGQAFSLMAQ